MARKSITTPVSAKTIRTAFQTGALDPAKVVDEKGNAVPTGCLFGGPQGRGRGRLNPAFVEAFVAANPGTTYSEKSEAEVKMVEVPRVKTDAKGRTRTLKPATLPISEARALAGVSGKRGRLSSEDLARAGAALVAAGR